jgi:predicted transcriptional regulator
MHSNAHCFQINSEKWTHSFHTQLESRFIVAMRGRTRSEIIIDILIALNNSSELRTTVMYKCRLNHAQLKKHMQFLKERGLIEESSDDKWICSRKGRNYLSAYIAAERIID